MGSLFPHKGLKLRPRQWKCRVLTTGPPGQSSQTKCKQGKQRVISLLSNVFPAPETPFPLWNQILQKIVILLEGSPAYISEDLYVSISLKNPHGEQHSNHTVCFFFHLTIYLGDCFISIHKELPHSFLTAIKISIVWMYGNLFKQSLVDGHSGCLQSSVIINRAAVNSLVHPTLHTYMQVCLWNTF